VITFSLADEPSAAARFDAQRGFWCYVDQVRDALDAAGVERAAICGVSYGGLIAAVFAARYPERASSLVLVSALPPSWTPDRRVQFFLRAPRLLAPLFVISSLRLYSEIAAASQGAASGLRTALRHASRVVGHMLSPQRMARRVRFLASVDLPKEVAGVTLPTLVVTGEPRLDLIVPVRATREYCALWPTARVEMITNTGHLGLITRPEMFASIVVPFAERAGWDDSRSRRLG
jgi:pimeloyl-ACP methyl ester carboxylesterase